MNPNEQDLQPEMTEETPVETTPVVETEETPVEPTKAEKATAKAQEDAKKEKRSNLMYIIIAIVFVLFGIAALVWNSGILKDNTPAVTINGEDYSVAEVNYHFINCYQTFVSQYGDYISYLGLDTSTSLKAQTYMEDQTWYDYFLDAGLEQMSAVAALNIAAEAEGFAFDETVAQSKATIMEELNTYAPMYGYDDAQGYLQAVYGTSMTTEIYEGLLEQSLKAEAYSYAYQQSLVYDDATLEATYAATPINYDLVDFETLYVYNPITETDADGNAVEVTEEMAAASLAEAKEIANTLFEDYSAGASLSDVADSNDLAHYSSYNGAVYQGDVLSEWLFDESRTTGDSAVLADESSGVYHIAVFHDRYREDYNLANVRHILITPDVGTLASDEEGYQAEIDSLDAAADATAQGLLDQFLAGDATEEAFAALATANSTDTGSSANGGLYENIAKGQMVAPFEDWCFEAGRQAGDTGIVKTDYGYHVMYYVGTGMPAWEQAATHTLMEADYTAWYNDLLASVTLERNSSGIAFVADFM